MKIARNSDTTSAAFTKTIPKRHSDGFKLFTEIALVGIFYTLCSVHWRSSTRHTVCQFFFCSDRFFTYPNSKGTSPLIPWFCVRERLLIQWTTRVPFGLNRFTAPGSFLKWTQSFPITYFILLPSSRIEKCVLQCIFLIWLECQQIESTLFGRLYVDLSSLFLFKSSFHKK